jgi:hypothetical protein
LATLTGLIPEYASLGSGLPAQFDNADPEDAAAGDSSFTHDEAFPLIAQLIMTAAKVAPERFILHDAIVDLVLADSRGADIVARARSRSAWADDREAASNMVAWFSQQISVGRSHMPLTVGPGRPIVSPLQGSE